MLAPFPVHCASKTNCGNYGVNIVNGTISDADPLRADSFRKKLTAHFWKESVNHTSRINGRRRHVNRAAALTTGIAALSYAFDRIDS